MALKLLLFFISNSLVFLFMTLCVGEVRHSTFAREALTNAQRADKVCVLVCGGGRGFLNKH